MVRVVTGIMKETLQRMEDIRAIVVQDLTEGFSVFMMIMGILLIILNLEERTIIFLRILIAVYRIPL